MFNVKEREFVVPGQLLGDDIKEGSGCFCEDGKVYSSLYGLTKIDGKKITVIPLSGQYVPQRGDVVIGVIKDITGRGARIILNSAYSGLMSLDELGKSETDRIYEMIQERTPQPRGTRPQSRGRQFKKRVSVMDVLEKYSIGDIVGVKILGVNEVNDPVLRGPKKYIDGEIITTIPKRVPRVVGKKQSMINMIRDKTGCKIVVGQNGIIWVEGRHANVVRRAIKKIENEAYTSGLTDRVGEFIDEIMIAEKAKKSKTAKSHK